MPIFQIPNFTTPTTQSTNTEAESTTNTSSSAPATSSTTLSPPSSSAPSSSSSSSTTTTTTENIQPSLVQKTKRELVHEYLESQKRTKLQYQPQHQRQSQQNYDWLTTHTNQKYLTLPLTIFNTASETISTSFPGPFLNILVDSVASIQTSSTSSSSSTITSPSEMYDIQKLYEKDINHDIYLAIIEKEKQISKVCAAQYEKLQQETSDTTTTHDMISSPSKPMTEVLYEIWNTFNEGIKNINSGNTTKDSITKEKVEDTTKVISRVYSLLSENISQGNNSSTISKSADILALSQLESIYQFFSFLFPSFIGTQQSQSQSQSQTQLHSHSHIKYTANASTQHERVRLRTNLLRWLSQHYKDSINNKLNIVIQEQQLEQRQIQNHPQQPPHHHHSQQRQSQHSLIEYVKTRHDAWIVIYISIYNLDIQTAIQCATMYLHGDDDATPSSNNIHDDNTTNTADNPNEVDLELGILLSQLSSLSTPSRVPYLIREQIKQWRLTGEWNSFSLLRKSVYSLLIGEFESIVQNELCSILQEKIKEKNSSLNIYSSSSILDTLLLDIVTNPVSNDWLRVFTFQLAFVYSKTKPLSMTTSSSSSSSSSPLDYLPHDYFDNTFDVHDVYISSIEEIILASCNYCKSHKDHLDTTTYRGAINNADEGDSVDKDEQDVTDNELKTVDDSIEQIAKPSSTVLTNAWVYNPYFFIVYFYIFYIQNQKLGGGGSIDESSKSIVLGAIYKSYLETMNSIEKGM